MPTPTGDSAEPRPAAAFATTHWTRVLAARGESADAQQALRELCEAYYAPVHAFIRQAPRRANDARDLTHEFFAKLLAGHALDTLERGRGRFRSYLLGAVKHFLADVRDRDRAAKRGGGQTLVSVDALSTRADSDGESSAGLEIPDPSGFPPDAFFDRHWALHLLDRVVSALAREHAQAGKTPEFETLKPWLTGDAAVLALSDAAERLNRSEGATKLAIHRLRKQFRQVVKAEISSTVADQTEVSAEMAYLIEALSYGQPMDS